MKTRLLGAILALVLAAGGAFVLIKYVSNADIRAAKGAELVDAYLVATEIPARTPAEEVGEYLKVSKIPAAAAVTDRVTSLGDLSGLVADVALKPGEQLLKSRWVDPTELAARGDVELPDGMQAVSIALPVERVVGGTVAPGDTVGVVISAEAEERDSDHTLLLTRQAFHKVLVLGAEPGTSYAPDGDSESREQSYDSIMVTLAMKTPDVEELVWGKEWGTIWLTLEPEAADERGGRTVDGNVIFQ